MNSKELANKLFPDINESPDFYESRYKARSLPSDALVTRLGPSPTGFIHMGNLFVALACERLAHESGGVFYLRIEDTDDKRYVEGAVPKLINSLKYYEINFDEGPLGTEDVGSYGNYTQSQRVPIYQCYAKQLISDGKAYPCFLTEEEIADIRAKQEKSKLNPGIYKGWSKYRDFDTSPEIASEVQRLLESGAPYVIRLKSKGNPELAGDDIIRKQICDGIRGELSLPENYMDAVILKQNGIPTYHFAHAVDDHLMRTTHVVRGEEWLSSLPLHIELHEALGFTLPIYCHTAQLMKIDETGKKRKLSKRLDPELSLDYYIELGYHPDCVREYLMTILFSDYEEWRLANKSSALVDFKVSISKMSNSGTLFDLNKLNDVSKNTLLGMPASDIAKWFIDWLKLKHPEISYIDDMARLTKILDIGRNGDRPRADLIYGEQILEHISYMYDESFNPAYIYPDNIVSAGDVTKILKAYLDSYNYNLDKDEWFNSVKSIASGLGYAEKPKDYKSNPENFKGHVGHVSAVIRMALTGQEVTPDIWEIQQVLGEDTVIKRIKSAIDSF